jgi:hypothetical protein
LPRKAFLLGSILFISLNLLDASLTHLALDLGGMEINPIATLYGNSTLVKMSIVLVAIAGLWWYRRVRLLYVLNIFMLLVVAWNAGQIALGSY